MTDAVGVTTVEQLVRQQLAAALGGRRGIVESAVPTIAFTVSWIVTSELKRSLIISISITAVLLLWRLAQRSSPQFVLNSLVGIGIGAVFASRSGDARDVFLPGILYNGAYAIVLIASILIGWPLIGFVVGALVGDASRWRDDRGMVALCARLTWLLAVPCLVRVVVQYPLWAADQTEWLGVSKIALGWPLQVAALFAMAWLLSRNRIELEHPGLSTKEPETGPADG